MLSSGDTFLHPFEDNESDSETTQFFLMGEIERNEIEAEFEKLTYKIRDQIDLIDKRNVPTKKKLPD